jgi:hypothetical protein
MPVHSLEFILVDEYDQGSLTWSNDEHEQDTMIQARCEAFKVGLLLL